MRFFNNYTRLFTEAPAEGSEGGGEGTPKEKVGTKIKVGTKEYDEDSLSSAASLYEALQDPETGLEIIETLAKRAGLLNKDGEIKKEPGETKKEAEGRAAKKLKAKLGKDYEKFADSVGPVLDELLDEYVNEKLSAHKGEAAQGTWERAVDTFTGKYKTTPKIESKMQEFMEEAPPNFKGKNFDPVKYLTRMYKNACDELDISTEEVEEPKKRRRSARDFEDEFPDIVEREAPKNVTLDDAVEAAMKGIRFKKRS